MDSEVPKIREKNPRENASWISIVTFFFALKIFKKGLRRDIVEEDIYDIVKDFKSETMGDRLEKEWEIEKKKHRPWFLCTVIRIFWKQYLVIAVSLLIIETSVMIAYPLLVGKLVSYFTPGQTEVTINDALLYTAELVGLFTIYTLYIHTYLIFIFELSLKIKISCCALIYRKSLKLSLDSLSKCTNGVAVTLMTKDILQFDYATDCGLVVVVGIVQAAIMTYMLYSAIGISAILGASLLLVLFPLQGETETHTNKKQYGGKQCSIKSAVVYS